MTTGMGFRIDSVTVALALREATLTAVMETLPDVGMTDGGVYKPVEVIVPSAESPPTIPFASHETEVFVVPVTVAVNCVVEPIRVDAEPEMFTEICGVGGVSTLPLVLQPASVRDTTLKTRAGKARRREG